MFNSPYLAIITIFVLSPMFPLLDANAKFSEQDLDLVDTSGTNVASKTPKHPDTIRADFKKIQFSAQVGADVIWLNYQQPLKEWHFYPRIGYSAAALVDLSISNIISIETGLHFSKTGNNLTAIIDLRNTGIAVPFIDSTLVDSSQIIRGYVTNNIYSLSIPVNLLLKIPNCPIFLSGGIDVGYIIFAEGILQYHNANIRDEDTDDSGLLNRWNVSLSFGIGYKFLTFSKPMAVRLDSRIGLTSLAKKNDWVTDFESEDIALSRMVYF